MVRGHRIFGMSWAIQHMFMNNRDHLGIACMLGIFTHRGVHRLLTARTRISSQYAVLVLASTPVLHGQYASTPLYYRGGSLLRGN